jgi:hypothetical protein
MNEKVVSDYLRAIEGYFREEQSSEMSYRTPFQNYLEALFPKSEGYVVQHDQRSVGGNKPDFIVRRGDVPLLYIEVKKVGEDLNKIEKSSQATRYFGYTNLIISDYCEFRFYRNGEKYDEHIQLATSDTKNRTFIPYPQNAERLERTIRDFIQSQKEPIKSGKHLAKIMGGKAQRIRDNVIDFLGSENSEKDELVRMMRFIKEHLIATFSEHDFADMYAQTIVYGLFAARYNDPTANTFSRGEAQQLVPKSNPFLQHFFGHIAGVSFPKRLEIIVDELCEVFSHADVKSLMEEYFKQGALIGPDKETPDPVIHFYEDFLHEYDPAKKAERGVFYTPLPVVRFIVRGIDTLLKREFGITNGLANNEKVSIEVTGTNTKGKTVTDTKEMHRVQVLDVATGTGTFLNETIAHIYEAEKHNRGRWKAYVEDHLLPRLHGFELMMASYTIAHLKLSMTLAKEGIIDFKKRLGIYLTNTLDTPHDLPLQGMLFGVVESIAEESRLASQVKKEHPIMVVMGNPPYSGESQNPHYTDNDVYKVEPGGTMKLKERNSKWINDDYVKFIRFAESMIEKNGEGIIAMITAHGYIDNPTFRGMRWHLRETFDVLYVLDLHGNSNKKETTPEGKPDQNVFDIKTGVSIIFGVKRRSEEKVKVLAQVFQADLYGSRAEKFSALTESNFESIQWGALPGETDLWKIEGGGKAEYQEGFSVAELFPINGVGITTAHDDFVIEDNREVLIKRFEDFRNSERNADILHKKFNVKKKTGWDILAGYDNLKKADAVDEFVLPISYRPFDNKHIFYEDKLVWRTVRKIQNNLIKQNTALLFKRQGKQNFSYVFLTNKITESCMFESAYANNSVAPLYLYENGEKIPNLNGEIAREVESVVGRTTPEDMLDYVYAVLHSPSYRAKYGEFLKQDFPRVPYPKNKELFWKLVAHGRHLRELHLLTHPAVRKPITSFPEAGTDTIEKPVFKNGRVYINETQYWDGVPEAVWNFYIGGYQPAQKYLKDRKGRKLTTAEFENYERMIVALNETIKVMQEIDQVFKP